MTRTIWHCHIAVSLDGKIARPDGSFDWLNGYTPQEFGIEAFLAEVDAIVMGRATYEIARGVNRHSKGTPDRRPKGTPYGQKNETAEKH